MSTTAPRPAISKFAAGSAVVTLAMAGVLLTAAPAHAATFTVTSNADDGPGSLRAAIDAANLAVGGDTVTIEAEGLISLVSGDLNIDDDVTIVGPGAANLTITSTGRVFSTTSAVSVSISRVTVTTTLGDAAIYAEAAEVNLDRVNVLNTSGIGFYLVDGLHEITDSVITNPGTEGVRLSYSLAGTGAALSNVTVDSAGTQGIRLDQSAADGIESTFSNITVSNSGTEGVLANVSAGSVLFTDGEISTSGSHGFELHAVDADVSMSGTSSVNNGSSGFALEALDDSSVDVSTSTADDNGGDGFDVEAYGGSQVVLLYAAAGGNGDNGMELGAGTLSNVVAAFSTSEGSSGEGFSINVVDDAQVLVFDSESRDNDEGGAQINGLGAGGVVGVINSTIDGNGSGELPGGGINFAENTSVLLQIFGTTISNNDASTGGGIFADLNTDSALFMQDSTISGNTANESAALYAQWSSGFPEVDISHSTITENASANGAAVYIDDDLNAIISHTIIADNAGSDDLDVVGLPALDYNVIESATAASLGDIDAGTGNIYGLGASLGPLADNGGLTLTHLPQQSSVAVNAGEPLIGDAPDEDQRGRDRTVGVIDIGSVELQAKLLPATGSDPSQALLAGGGLAAIGALLAVVAWYRRKVTA